MEPADLLTLSPLALADAIRAASGSRLSQASAALLEQFCGDALEPQFLEDAGIDTAAALLADICERMETALADARAIAARRAPGGDPAEAKAWAANLAPALRAARAAAARIS